MKTCDILQKWHPFSPFSYFVGMEAVDKASHKSKGQNGHCSRGRVTKINCVCTGKWPVWDENKVGSGPHGVRRPNYIFAQLLSLLSSAPYHNIT